MCVCVCVCVCVFVCVFVKELLGVSVCIFPKGNTRENNKVERVFLLYDVNLGAIGEYEGHFTWRLKYVFFCISTST